MDDLDREWIESKGYTIEDSGRLDNKDRPIYTLVKDGACTDVVIWSNGSVARVDNNKIMLPPVASKRGIRSDNTAEIHAARRQAAARAASKGLSDATGGNGWVLGWRKVVSSQALLALDTAKGQASTRAAEFVGRAAGIFGQDSGGDSPAAGASLSISPDVALRIAEYIASRRGSAGHGQVNVIDGQVNDD